jgi:hypothetical protein
MKELQFEKVETNLGASFMQRAKVPMGWLVEDSTDVAHMSYAAQYGCNGPSGFDWRISLTFVFDPFHLWR